MKKTLIDGEIIIEIEAETIIEAYIAYYGLYYNTIGETTITRSGKNEEEKTYFVGGKRKAMGRLPMGKITR